MKKYFVFGWTPVRQQANTPQALCYAQQSRWEVRLETLISKSEIQLCFFMTHCFFLFFFLYFLQFTELPEVFPEGR